MDFFPDVVPPEDLGVDVDEPAQPPWLAPPDDVLPGIVPLGMVIGRSLDTAVTLTGVRAYPSGLGMTLGVCVRGSLPPRDLDAEVFDGPYLHDRGADWQQGRLKWGFELGDGRRVTNVDPSAWAPACALDGDTEPAGPLLTGGGGGGGPRSVDRHYWLWPLPPPGHLRVACQWLDQDIDLTLHDLDVRLVLDAAARAESLWPGAPET